MTSLNSKLDAFFEDFLSYTAKFRSGESPRPKGRGFTLGLDKMK